VIRIALKDGRVLDNDPAYGMNLSTVEDIRECLEVDGRYRWVGPNGGYEPLYPSDIDRIYEDTPTEEASKRDT
jgi:hypothetical protein